MIMRARRTRCILQAYALWHSDSPGGHCLFRECFFALPRSSSHGEVHTAPLAPYKPVETKVNAGDPVGHLTRRHVAVTSPRNFPRYRQGEL